MEVGAFREDLPVLGDWDFNVRFLKAYEIGVIPRILAYYHDRDQGEAVAYHSSVSAKADLHLFYDNMLRNEWLREDIAQGICGIGTLSSFGRLFQDFSWEMKDELQKKRKIILFPRK
jgi:hypothetical protein